MVNNSFKTTELVELLNATKRRLNDCAIPVVLDCIENSRSIEFSTPEYKSDVSVINRVFKLPKQDPLIFRVFLAILNTSDKLIDTLLVETTKKFGKIVDNDSLTYVTGQIVSFANCVDLIITYIPKYCKYIIALETDKRGGDKITKYLTKVQINYVKDNKVNFFNAVTALNLVNQKGLSRILNETPDVNINSEVDGLTFKKLDSTGVVSRFLPAKFNPFFYIQMAWADYQYSKYKAAKEEVESIKLDLDYLNTQVASGNGDAYLEKQRNLAKERLDKLEYDISKYEEKALNSRY